MRRRHQKSPLLMRIIGISILFHIIALPILAHFGALKKIQDHFAGPQIVFVPPPPPADTEKHETKKASPHPRQIALQASHAQPHAGQAQRKSNLNIPHVISGAGDKGPSVEQGSKDPGFIPTPKTEATRTVEPDRSVEGVKPIEKSNEIAKPIDKPVKPIEKPIEPAMPAEPVKSTAPIYTAAEPMDEHQPQPTIPDDLRSEALDRACIVEFVVGTDGRPTSVHITASSNNQQLDQLALQAARQWRFRPATRDGRPVEGKVRLHLEFQVS